MIQVLRTFFRKFLVSKTNSSIFRWVATLVFSFVLFFSVVTIAFVAVLRDREVQIPQRFASKILSEINSISSSYILEASSVHLSLDEGFLPELKISNVDLFYSNNKLLHTTNYYAGKQISLVIVALFVMSEFSSTLNLIGPCLPTND